jgi:hypothetical protein
MKLSSVAVRVDLIGLEELTRPQKVTDTADGLGEDFDRPVPYPLVGGLPATMLQ